MQTGADFLRNLRAEFLYLHHVAGGVNLHGGESEGTLKHALRHRHMLYPGNRDNRMCAVENALLDFYTVGRDEVRPLDILNRRVNQNRKNLNQHDHCGDNPARDDQRFAALVAAYRIKDEQHNRRAGNDGKNQRDDT